MSEHFDYCPFYCEENAWRMIQRPDFEDACVMFITNRDRHVAVWQQRLAQPDDPMVWDYHVVVISFQRRLVWDLDTRLPCPSSAMDWLNKSFPQSIRDALDPMFHVIDRLQFLEEFGSDRSHMKVDGNYLQPPPNWEPATGDINLASFLDTELAVGRWFDLSSLKDEIETNAT